VVTSGCSLMLSSVKLCLPHVRIRTGCAAMLWALLAATLASPAYAQGQATPGSADQGETAEAVEASAAAESSAMRISWGVNTGAAYQFRTDIDGGGDFSTSRYSVGAGGVFQLSDQLELNVNAGFERDDYRFSSVTRMGN